jgi:chromosome segregation ATPase
MRRYTCTKREGAEVVLMSQTFFEPEVSEQQRSKQAPVDAVGETAAVTLSADDFTALEDRVVRAVELVKRERQARAAAEERAAKAEAQLAEETPVVEQLKQEIRTLRTERDQVRQRVERLLTQLDALEL